MGWISSIREGSDPLPGGSVSPRLENGTQNPLITKREPLVVTSADWTEDQLNADLAPALEIMRPIGQGSLSNDFVAREAALKRLVTIKVLRREFADEQKARLRFEREAQAAARISHNHVATVFWVGQLSDEVPYIVQEYVRGRTLAEHLAATGPIPTSEVRRILSEVASGLAAAHEKRVIHRNITPSNIMIEEQTGRALITDFGLAATVATGAESPERITKTGEIIGDPIYLSPEQRVGDPVTEVTDVYSLGMLAYELLAYEPRSAQVGQITTTAQLWGTGTGISELRDDVASDFEELVSRCLSEKPGNRPSAADAAQALSAPPVPISEAVSPPGGTADSKPPFLRLLSELRKRRFPQIVVPFGAAAWAATEVGDMMVERSWLPPGSSDLLLSFLIVGLPAAMVVAWFHGEKGPQDMPRIEAWILGALGLVWVAWSVVVLM